MAGTVTITALSASELAGQRVLGPLSIVGTIVEGETLTPTLTSGDNTFTIPTASVGFVLIPPTTGSTQLSFRYDLNSSDTGTPLCTQRPSMLTFPTSPQPPAQLIINSSGVLTAPISIWFW